MQGNFCIEPCSRDQWDQWRKGKVCTLLVGMFIGAATVGNSMELPQKTKNRTTI